ncbi:unnamed protein product [Toxocara canis]|uniref:DUF148 domain-containing protein n=1 Tax=Toxocara canis TaxID=6265 RepID=A0A183UYS6_TOXCA|nr:unnamed protein product [Toxocara canis]
MRTFIAVAVFVSTIFALPSPQIATLELTEPAIARYEALMPKFVQVASPDARKEFWQIVGDKDATIEETQSKLQKWAAEQGGDVKKYFETMAAKIKDMITALSEAIEHSSLPQAAKDAFKKLGEITSDDNQTFAQQLQEIVDYMKTLPEDTRKEMRKFIGDLIKSAIEKAHNN